MLIVEGPDGSGKTTLITYLQAHFRQLAVAPRVVSKDTQALLDLKVWVEQDLANPQLRIYDRYRLISELIYGPILRGRQEPGFSDFYWVYEKTRRLQMIKPLIIYCLPDIDVIRENLAEDVDNQAVNHKTNSIYTAYAERVTLDLLNPEVKAVVYDYTDHDDLPRILSTVNIHIYDWTTTHHV